MNKEEIPISTSAVLRSFRLQFPATCIITGPSDSGKTFLLSRLLVSGANAFDIRGKIDRVIYCYDTYVESTFKYLAENGLQVELIKGIPEDVERFEFDSTLNNVIIFDDLADQAVKSRVVSKFFTQDSHHKRVFVFLLSQNFYTSGIEATTISKNATYNILMKNIQANQIRIYASQNYSSSDRANNLIKSYELISEASPYGYLLVDRTKFVAPEYSLRTDILKGFNCVVLTDKFSAAAGSRYYYNNDGR